MHVETSSTHATNSSSKRRMSLTSLLTPKVETSRRTYEDTLNESIDVYVNVTIDDGKATFSYNGNSNLSIPVCPGEALITLSLVSNQLQPVQFVSNPINWVTDPGLGTARPLPDPENMTVERAGTDMCTIFDVNPGIEEVSFFFLISVMIDGKVYTSPDPTILNRKIDSQPPSFSPQRR